MKYFNQAAPSVLLGKDGTILMCNDQFETMMTEQLKVENHPVNFLKFIGADSKASSKLQAILKSMFKTSGIQHSHSQ